MIDYYSLDLEALLPIVVNRNAHERDRIGAIDALLGSTDDQVVQAYLRIAFDPTENLEVRCRVVEMFLEVPVLVDTCIRLLSDESPDLRFWAAYRLSQAWGLDTAPALDALDRVAAFDHQLPTHWGWHVDREALEALEQIYSQPYRMYGIDHEFPYSWHGGSWLISPQAEYTTFIMQYRRWRENWIYDTLHYDPPQLNIDPDWLKQAIAKRWDHVEFNVRQPKPRTYVLDWHITLYGQHLIGGLHRDQSSIVLTGKESFVMRFAAWYRSIFVPKQLLLLYDWAGIGIELQTGWSAKDVQTAVKRHLDVVWNRNGQND
ncbi:MAG: HEAT repeat domain-containing protein [Chloroflexi bacterium]|uniref:HEAT repeat domain-containing protein n=1 Tax=Candidatus Flexifilum breve TaxID=3140694 RepID=UPI00313759C6|nr:HEAT repeat domain-containing protein [Chloroflexota bacterium]